MVSLEVVATAIVLLLATGMVVGGAVVLAARGRSRSAAPNDASRKVEAAGLGPDQDLGKLNVGDIVALWDGREVVVERVVQCQETLPGRVTRWRWAFVEGGQLLSLAPSENVLYANSVVLYQGTEPYELLTCDVEQGGVLKTFEARVQEGIVGRNPVFFEHEGQSYRVLSTGTFGVPDQPVPEAEVWSDVQVDDSQNVYFRLASEDGTQALGIWTSHIALLTGRALSSADVREIYRVGR